MTELIGRQVTITDVVGEERIMGTPKIESFDPDRLMVMFDDGLGPTFFALEDDYELFLSEEEAWIHPDEVKIVINAE